MKTFTKSELEKMRDSITPSWTIAGGNDEDDYSFLRGLPHYHLFSLKDGSTIGYVRASMPKECALIASAPDILAFAISLLEERKALLRRTILDYLISDFLSLFH